MESKSPNQLMQEIQELRDRISKLSAASLRISASLDLDTVLTEVVESARELTGAVYGGISTIGESGQPEDFVSFRLCSRGAPPADGLDRRTGDMRTVPGA